MSRVVRKWGEGGSKRIERTEEKDVGMGKRSWWKELSCQVEEEEEEVVSGCVSFAAGQT